MKGAYIIKGEDVILDENGEVAEIICSYYSDTKSGSDNSGIKAKGTLHWVDQQTAVDLHVNLYDRIFTDPTPDQHEDKDYMEFINEDSLSVVTAKAERSLAESAPGDSFQFMRKGYFVRDIDSGENLIFNRTVTLRDSWAKKQKKK